MSETTNWQYWFITDLCLAAGIFLIPDMLLACILIVTIHCIHFFIKSPYLFSFPMQVKLGYLCLLCLGYLPYFGWIHWVQLVGTTALISIDYCPLARIFSLMPWNRIEGLTWKFVRTAFLSRPVEGSIIELLSPGLVDRLHPEKKSQA